MIFGDVEGEKVFGGEVLVAGGAAVGVGLSIVGFKVAEGGEGECWMRGQGAFHCWASWGGGRGGMLVFCGMGGYLVKRRWGAGGRW